MEIKTIAKSTVLLAGPKIIQFIVGIVRAKLIAVYLGTTGSGIINQLRETIQQISTFALSSVPEGMVKLIAQENAIKIDIEKIGSIIKTYLVLIIPLSVLVTVFGYVFADKITIFVFGSIEYKLYFQIGFAAIPISIMTASTVSVLQAFKEIKSIAISGIVIILINFILFIPLIYFYKITGGVIYVTLSFFITFFVFYFYMKKNIFQKYNISFKDIKSGIFSNKYFKELIKFMGFGLVSGTYYIFTEISTRAIVVNELGIDKLGIYAPIAAWGGLFTGFILPSMGTYLFPRISEAKDNQDIIGVINDVIRLTTFITLPFVIIGISIRQWIIPLFYSTEFIEASIYLPFHFAGLLFTIWTFAFTYIFAPTGRLKSYLIFAIIFHSISLALVYFLVPKYGLFGYLSKFTIVPIITTLGYFIYWNYEIKFKLESDNIKIIIYTIFSICLLLLLKDEFVSLLIITLPLIFVQFLFLKKQEKEFLYKKLSNFL